MGQRKGALGHTMTRRSLASWYRGRKIFLTGHTGFKGAWLCAWLQNAGADLTGYSLAPEPNGLFAAAGLDRGMASLVGDVRDQARLEQAMRDAAPEIIIHMAAQSLVRRSYAEPVATYSTNVMGTVHLLDNLRRIPSVRAAVIVTSDKCYEHREPPHPFREGEPLGGHDPYSSSKAAAEIVTSGLARSFFGNGFPAIASARAGNVVGGGDWAEDRLIPDLIRAAMTDTPARIRRPGATRPWQYVLEPLRGYLLLGRRLAEQGSDFAGPWNFGPDPASNASVQTVVSHVCAAWNRVTVHYEPEPSGPHEAAALSLDSRKARGKLGWTPTLDLETTLRQTTTWYRNFCMDPGAARSLLQDDLKAYEHSAELTEGVE